MDNIAFWMLLVLASYSNMVLTQPLRSEKDTSPRQRP